MAASSPFGGMPDNPATQALRDWLRSTQAQANNVTSVTQTPWMDMVKEFVGLAHRYGKGEEKDSFGRAIGKIDEQLAALRKQRQDFDRLYGPGAEKTPGAIVNMAPAGDYVSRVSKFESTDNPTAVNKGSGASGRFQFIPSTWQSLMKEAPHLGLTAEGILDDEQQHKAMQYYTNKSASILRPLLGRSPTGGELYLSHLLGHSGGPAVLRNLNAPITETIDPRAYAGNPFLRNYKTGHDLIAALNYQFGGGPKPVRNASEETGSIE